jgi:hypothetical protein
VSEANYLHEYSWPEPKARCWTCGRTDCGVGRCRYRRSSNWLGD